MAARSTLSTIQTIARLAVTVAMPFWELGYLFSTLSVSRGEPVSPGSLLSGFRHFGPSLRLLLLKALPFVCLAFVVSYPAMTIYFLTPLGKPLAEAMLPAMAAAAATGEVMMDEAVMNALIRSLPTMLACFLTIYLLLAAPIFYRFRMAELALADAPEKGALAALRTSARIMRGSRFDLFRLDLTFWWFFLLEALATILCYGDTLLPLLGISLPMSETVSYFLFYALGLTAQILVYWKAKNYVFVTYAAVYDQLNPRESDEAEISPVRNPW